MFTIKADKTLQQIMQLLHLTGLWQSDEEPEYRKIGKKVFYTVFGTLYPLDFFATALLSADPRDSIFPLQLAVLVSVIYVKLLYLLFKKPEILAFLNDQVVVHSIENREEFEQASKTIKQIMAFIRLYCLFICLSCPVTTIMPLFSSKKVLPVFVDYPWSDSEIIYWSVYVLLSLSVVLSVITVMATTMLWYIMVNYTIEFRLLGNRLRRLGREKKDEKQKFSRLPQRSTFLEDFIVLIKDHRNLTEQIERFRSCFATLFLNQITISGIAICGACYNLAFASKENVAEAEMYVCSLSYAVFDIILVMYLANDITLESDTLSYCLFESNWIEQTESCKKYLLIMGEILKKPHRLRIFMYQMNLETLMSIISGAYSMFNVLKTVE